MYSLRQMQIEGKVCEQVDVRLLEQVYPREAIEQSVGQSQPWTNKRRRVRHSTLLSLVWWLLLLGLWGHLNQRQVWDKLTGLRRDLTGRRSERLSASALSARREALGYEGLQRLMHTCCLPLARRGELPTAFFGRYRLLAIDGTRFTTPDPPANDAAFGRSRNQYGVGAYPQVRAVLLVECGS